MLLLLDKIPYPGHAMRTIVAAFCVSAWLQILHAQIVVDAGKDTLQLCQGMTVRLGGSPTALGGRAPYQYHWEPSVGLSDPTAPNPLLTALRSHQRYILTVTDADGAVGRDTVFLIMLLPPRISAGGIIQVCVGQDVTLGGTPTAYGGESPYRFEWFGLPGTARNINSSNPVFRADRVQDFQVVLRVTDARGCSAVDTAHISITQPITLAFRQRVLEICAGEPVQIGANPLANGGTAPYRIEWSPAGSMSSPTVPNPTVFPTVTTQYFCTVTDAKGCVRTDSILVRVKPAMTLRLRDTSICYGKEIQLGDSTMVSGGVPPYEYWWEVFDNQGRPVSDSIDRRALVQRLVPPATRMYRLIVRDQQGCTQRATMTVVVTEPPVAEFALPPEICQGKTIIFGTVYNRLFTYLWQVEGAGGVIVGDPMSNIVRIRWDSSGLSRVSLSVYDQGKGCDYFAEATVRVHPLPTPEIRVEGRAHLCPGEMTTLDAGEGYVDYVWSNGARSRRITLNDQQAGIYTVTVTDSQGCTNTSPPAHIRANTTPRPTISGPRKFCAGTTIELRATPGFSTYRWSSGQTTPTIAISEPGTFMVTVTDSIGCEGSSEPFSTEFNPVSMNVGGNTQFTNRETLLDYPAQTIYFINTDDEPLTLRALRLTPYHPDLRIVKLDIEGRQIANVNGQVLRVGERLNVHLQYLPQVPDTTIVRVELEVVLPCPWTYIQVLNLSSYDKRIPAIATVISTRGTIGETIDIPLHLQLVNAQDSIIDATVEYTVRINAKMFDFRQVHLGTVLSAVIDANGWYSIRIVRQDISLRNTEPVLLGIISGIGLASTQFHDSVLIATITVRDVLKQPVVQVRNGVLTLNTYCFPRDIIVRDRTAITVLPNPATDQLQIEVRDASEGIYAVEIVTIDGKVLERKQAILGNGVNSSLAIPLGNIPSGVMLVRIITPTGVFHSRVAVVR